jgi:photosystem II stability/assembly factor-like uncharacterized protein
VCNGAPGANGTTGTQGPNGVGALIDTVAIASGNVNCPYGGTEIITGLNNDGTGVLIDQIGNPDPRNLLNTSLVCNGGGMSWANVTGTSQQMVSNAGYIADNNTARVVLTLPTSPNVGDVLRIKGEGLAGWSIAQNAGQSIVIAGVTTHFPASSTSGWTAQTSGLPVSASWQSVASSADGTHLVAAAYFGVGIYTSADSGATWTQQMSGLPASGWSSVASSADGTHLVAVGDSGVYTYVDSSATWTLQTSGLPASAAAWQSVASSVDGTNLVAVGYTGIYTSADSGATWTQQTNGLPASVDWLSVASSADGTRLVAVEELTGTGAIYTSADSGATWWQLTVGLPASAKWYSVASSADGKYMVAVVRGGGIYASADGGASWTQQTTGALASASWKSVASSADGTHLVAVALSSGSVYTNGSTEPINSNETTTTGTSGYVSGGPYDSLELLYLGNGSFGILSSVGTDFLAR